MANGDRRWPSVEAVVMQACDDLGETRQFMPPTFDGTIIAVLRVGGTSDRITDRPVVQIACFNESYEQASKVAEEVRERLTNNGKRLLVENVPGYAEPILLDKVTVVTGPVEVTYDDPEKRRKILRLQISMRKHLVDD